jgi:hypothetical protein
MLVAFASGSDSDVQVNTTGRSHRRRMVVGGAVGLGVALAVILWRSYGREDLATPAFKGGSLVSWAEHPSTEADVKKLCGHSASDCLGFPGVSFDLDCAYGGLGCDAGGYWCCRYCGFDDFAEIKCPASGAKSTVSLDEHQSRLKAAKTKADKKKEAADKAAAAKIVADKAAAKAAAAYLAVADKADKAAKDKAAAHKAAAKKAADAKIVADQAAAKAIAADEAAKEKAAAHKFASDKAADAKIVADKAAAKAIAADEAAKEKADKEKAAADKAAADQIVADKKMEEAHK